MAIVRYPGLIDVHVHLREPGATHKEDFITGSRAAIKGGFTRVLDMPNNPIPTTTIARLKQKIKLAQKASCQIGFHFGTNGKNLKHFKSAYKNKNVYGLKLYCNHTTGEMLIEDINLLTKVFAAWNSQKPILVHAEGVQLSAVIALAHLYKRKLHVCHISQAVEVKLVSLAKKSGQNITAGVCPHHLFMTNKDVPKIGSLAMMKPPLGTKQDQNALWQGINDHTIDVVGTDHAPHTLKEKESKTPPFGVPGLETAVGLLYLGVKKKLIRKTFIRKLLYDNPKKIFSLPSQTNTYIKVDEDRSWTVGKDGYETKCNWSPFDGWKLPAKVTQVVIKGKTVLSSQTPFYDPTKSYKYNFDRGPFGLFSKKTSTPQKGKPTHSFLGHKVYLPFGIPAGPLLNSKFVTAAFKNNFDILTYKTVRTRKYKCHSHPNILSINIDGDLTLRKAKGSLKTGTTYQHPLSITNSFGVPSKDPDWWQKDMAKANKSAKRGQVMIGSFQGTADGSGKFENLLSDYVLAAKLVKQTGTPILEANLSCPNEGKSYLLCFDVERVRQISWAIKKEIGDTPLLLKLAYFETNAHLTKLIKAVGNIIDGFAAINTIPAKVINKKNEPALPGEGRLISGICGRSIQWAGLEMTSRLKQLREKLNMNFAIVGVGGVTLASDYNHYISNGADAVMSATGAMWNPILAEEIKSA